MNRPMPLLLTLVFSVTFTIAPCRAMVVTCVNCSENLTQALEHATSLSQLETLMSDYAESVQQTIQQIEMVANQVKQYENMVQNTVKLPETMMGDVLGAFNDLASSVTSLQTQVGDIAAMGNLFDQLYSVPDLLTDAATAGRETQAALNTDYFAKWQEWTDAIDAGCESAFRLSGQQLEDIVQDAAAFEDHMRDLLSTPEGQMEALEAGNELAALQINEARQLRTLLAVAQQQATAVEMRRQQEDQLTAELWREFTRTDKLDGVSGSTANPDPF